MMILLKSVQLKRHQSGSIALTSVIVITAILLSGGITLLLTSIDLSNTRKGQTASTKAQFQYQSCLEESLRRLTINPNFTGSVSVEPSGQELCSATITTDPVDGNIKIITTTVTIGSYTQEYVRKVDASTNLTVVE